MTALTQPGMKRGGMLDVLLDEVRGVVLRTDVEAAARDQPAALDGVGLRVRQRDELVVLLELGKWQSGGEPHSVSRESPNLLERTHHGFELATPRGPVEPAYPDVDRVDLAASDDLHQLVADSFQPQGTLDHRAVLLGHLQRARVTEEVGRMQHEHVQRVALNPLTAVQEATQFSHARRNLDPAYILHRGDRAGLIGHWADAADPGSDVRDLGEPPAA